MRDPTIRNVIVLAFCQALANIAMTMNMTVTALAGKLLAVDPSLATLPLGLQFTATMAMTIPASLLMKRIGRRGGFAIGAGIEVVAGTAAAALFAGFCAVHRRFDFDRRFYGVCLILSLRRRRYCQRGV